MISQFVLWFHSITSGLGDQKNILGCTYCLWGYYCSWQWAWKWADVQVATAAATSVVIWVKQSFWRTFYSLSELWNYNWSAVEPPSSSFFLNEEISFGRGMKSYPPMVGQWRTLTICVIMEDRYETPLTIESHFNIKGQMRGIPEEMRKSMCSKLAVLCFFACSISCPCRCAFCPSNGLTVAAGWTNKHNLFGQDLNILSFKTGPFP